MRQQIVSAALVLLIALIGCSNDTQQTESTQQAQSVQQTLPGNTDQQNIKLMNPHHPDSMGQPTPPADPNRAGVNYVEPEFTVTSEELVSEFTSTDVPAMNTKYAGKVIEVQGTICFVDQVTYPNGIDHGAVYVNLCPTEKYEPKTVRCEFVMDTMYTFSGPQSRLLIIGGDDTLSRGEEVVIRGYYKHIGPRDFRMDDCQLMRH